jgi:class 3 adenylate cyclase
MVRSALSRHRGHEVGTTGDGFLATCDAAGRAIRFAGDIVADAKDIGLELRAGLHTREVERRGADVAGLSVTIAKRVCDLAGAGQVQVTRTVADVIAGEDIKLSDNGKHQLKGVPGTWRLFFLGGGRS